MSRLDKHIVRIGMFSLLLLACSASAQKNADSLLKKANALLYDDPNASIAIAKQVYDFPNVSIKNKVNALLSISTAYASKRDYQGAQDYIVKIENLLPEIKNQPLKMNILNRMGAQYQDLQIYDKAIEYLNQSLALIENYPKKDSVQTLLGYNHTVRGFIYREQMNCNIALTYFDKAIAAYLKTNDRYVRNANLSVCYYNKGNCLLATDQTEAAKASYSQSITYAQVVNAKSLIAFAQKGMAEVKTTEGNYRASIAILKEALQLSNGVGDLILNRGIYDGLANNYLAVNDWDNYTFYQQQFVDLQNKTRSSERKTINQSLLNLAQTRAKEIKALHTFYIPIQILEAMVLLFCIVFLIRFLIRSEKKLIQLKERFTK